MPDDLAPRITQRPADPEIQEARAEYLAALDQIRTDLQPRIDGNLLACREVLGQLADLHRRVVDESDIDLTKPTRWVALWELSGRCLALGSALVEQVRIGFGAEAAGTMRVIHEACNLAHAVSDDQDGDLTRRWLAGETIMPRDLIGHLEDFEAEATAIIASHGIPVQADLVDITKTTYHRFSQAAHNARPGFSDSVSIPLRLFAYGPHPDIRATVVYVEQTGVLVESCLIAAGHALSTITGGDFYREKVLPLINQRQAVEETLPVDAAVRAHYGWNPTV